MSPTLCLISSFIGGSRRSSAVSSRLSLADFSSSFRHFHCFAGLAPIWVNTVAGGLVAFRNHAGLLV
jgi:hypothetical protein